MLHRLFRRLGQALGLVSNPVPGQAAGQLCPHCNNAEWDESHESHAEPGQDRRRGWWVQEVGWLVIRRRPLPRRGTIQIPERIDTRLGCSICEAVVTSPNTQEGDRCPWCDRYDARYVPYERVTPGRDVPIKKVECWVECSKCGWRPNGETWLETVELMSD